MQDSSKTNLHEKGKLRKQCILNFFKTILKHISNNNNNDNKGTTSNNRDSN